MSQPHRLIAPWRGAWIASVGFLLLFPLSAAAVNLASLTVNPTTVVSGSPLTLTITLDGPAPTGGAPIALTSDPPGIVNFLFSTEILAAGVTSEGSLPTVSAVATPTTVTLQASWGGVTRTATVTVLPRAPVRGVAGDLWADVILGKPDFTEIVANQITGHTLFNPGGVIVDRSVRPNRVYVYDGGNSRILGLSHLGTCAGGTNAGENCTSNSDCPSSTCAIQEGRDADLVLGQPSLTRSACNGDGGFQLFPKRAEASAATLCSMPDGQISILERRTAANMFVDAGGSLFVTDFENHRVLRYNSPFTTDTVADDVWGQEDFTGKECNRGRGLNAPDNQSLCISGPDTAMTAGVEIDSAGNLWVTDNQNHRVLRFPRDPATGSPGHVADMVLGQPNFASSASGTGLNQMHAPAAVRVDGTGTVYVADLKNNRVLIFDPPLVSGKTARKLNSTFTAPAGLEFDPATGGLWVNNVGNNQLLLFVGGVVQKVLLRDVAGPQRAGVIGDRPDFYSEGDHQYYWSWNLSLCDGSIGIDSDGNVLATGVQDDVWRFPAPIPAPTLGIAHSADARIFKAYEFWSTNEVGLAGTSSPGGVAVTPDQLIVADGGRLLFWNHPPNFTNGQTADGFLGTTDPRFQPAVHGTYFAKIREDGNAHLWAIWTDKIQAYSLPLETGASPIVTIGPPLPVLGGGSLTWDWVSLDIGGIAPTAAGDKVWIADPRNNRVFRIRTPLTNPVVDIILGQTSYSGIKCNQNGQATPSRTSLCSPGSVRLDPLGNLYVADDAPEVAGNFRLLEYDATLFPDAPTKALFAIPASRVFGTGGSFTTRGCQGWQSEPCVNGFEPAFTSDGQMVIGLNGYSGRFPFVYTNPLVSQRVSTFLNDFYSGGGAATFDSNNNLYVTDGCRSRVLIYQNPLPNAPPGTSTLTVTKTGGGTGTVKSTPFGIDCGTACSQSYIDGTNVTLSTVPGTNSIFAGWTGDSDCSDSVVTMSNNKTCTARFELKPDLIVSALTAPVAALADSTISVTDTTKNNTGTGPAGASTTKLYLSTNTTWDANDTYLGSRPVPGLATGGISTAPTNLTIAVGTATGNYYVIAKADADNVLLESSETNNTKYASIRISPPDLIIYSISVPTTGGAGTNITATNTTKNNTGTGPAPASTTKFYLSANSTLDGNDPEIGSQAVGTLAPGASEVHSNTSLTIPPGTAPGTKYIIAKADADGLIPETLETNNTASDTIVIGPDLVVSALTVPTYGGAGLSITITSTTKNQGGGSAAASTTKFYLSTNNTYGAGDVWLGDRPIGTLNAGATSAGNVTLTIPANTPLGSYYVLARADGATVVPETIETNNVTAAAIKLSPDLIVSALTVPASAQAGHAFNVTDTTKCSGMGVAAASTTKFYLSTNATWDAGDTELGSRAVPQLTYPAVSSGSTSVTIPTAGPWYILAKADATGLVTETSETNNVTYKVITITP